MPKKNDEIDIDEELRRISRRTNINIIKSQKAFDNKIKDLEKEIEKSSKIQVNEFDSNKRLLENYLLTDFRSSTIDNYRRKLKKI
jgi:hypothetical protein